MTSYYKEGDYNVICSRSGMRFKRSECRFEWDGKLVARKFWKPRHPQDLPPHVPKPSIPDYTNPPTYNFVGTNEVTTDDL